MPIKITKKDFYRNFRTQYKLEMPTNTLLAIETDPIKNAQSLDDKGLKYVLREHPDLTIWHSGAMRWSFKCFAAALAEYRHRFGEFPKAAEEAYDRLLQKYNAAYGGPEWQSTKLRFRTPRIYPNYPHYSTCWVPLDQEALSTKSPQMCHTRRWFILEPEYRVWTNRTPPKWYTRNWHVTQEELEIYKNAESYEIDESGGV